MNERYSEWKRPRPSIEELQGCGFSNYLFGKELPKAEAAISEVGKRVLNGELKGSEAGTNQIWHQIVVLSNNPLDKMEEPQMPEIPNCPDDPLLHTQDIDFSVDLKKFTEIRQKEREADFHETLSRLSAQKASREERIKINYAKRTGDLEMLIADPRIDTGKIIEVIDWIAENRLEVNKAS